MLKNIFDIINKYNEDGTIVEKNNKFYWFNGKRYEFWCSKPKNASYYIYYKSKLYVSVYHQVHEYKNKQFILSQNKDILLKNLLEFRYCCLYKDHSYALIGKHLWQSDKYGRWIETPNLKPTNCGTFLFGYKNCIYIIDNCVNEKLNLLTNTWSEFKKNTHSIQYGCFFNNKFYNLFEDIVDCYDPKSNTWTNNLTI